MNKNFSLFPYINDLQNMFGKKFLLLIISIYFGVKGALRNFGIHIALPFYKYGNWTGTELQLSNSIAFTPWALQGFCAILSDIFPIFGYYKTSYLIIYCLVGISSMVTFIIVPMNTTNISPFIPSLLFLCIELMVSWTDIITSAKYTVIMRSSKDVKGNIVTFSYFCLILGQILPAFTIGPLTDRFDVRYTFIIFLPFSIQPLFFLFSGCMINDRVTKDKNNKIDKFILFNNWRVILLATLIAFSGISNLLLSFVCTIEYQMIYILFVGIILIIANIFLLPSYVAKMSIFIFLNFLLYVKIYGAIEYFYTSDESCIEDGPHFSFTFYKTYAALASIFAQIIGIIIFQCIFTSWKYRPIFYISTFLKCLASLIDFIIVKRWNKTIGIPDSYMYFFGHAIMYELTYMIDIIPVTLMISKLAPLRIEGTVVSLIASYANLGGSFSHYLGSFFIKMFDIIALPQGPGCNFENLHILILICHFILPLILIPLTFVFVPNKYLKETFQDSFGIPECYFLYNLKKKIAI